MPYRTVTEPRIVKRPKSSEEPRARSAKPSASKSPLARLLPRYAAPGSPPSACVMRPGFRRLAGLRAGHDEHCAGARRLPFCPERQPDRELLTPTAVEVVRQRRGGTLREDQPSRDRRHHRSNGSAPRTAQPRQPAGNASPQAGASASRGERGVIDDDAPAVRDGSRGARRVLFQAPRRLQSIVAAMAATAGANRDPDRLASMVRESHCSWETVNGTGVAALHPCDTPQSATRGLDGAARMAAPPAGSGCGVVLRHHLGGLFRCGRVPELDHV